jgi:hypothetical protein
VEIESAALFVAFQEAHLDHIRSMKIRLIFIRARHAFAAAHQLANQLRSDLRSSVQFLMQDYVEHFTMPIMLLTGSVNRLDRKVAELQSRLRSELGD